MSENKKVILIIDDSEAIRKEVKMILENDIYIVREAENEVTMLEMMEKDNVLPSLVLMDITLEGTNGFKLSALLKGDARYKHIPIIMLTIHDDNTNRDLANLLRIQGYITKPFRADVLKSRILNQLNQK